MGAADGVLEKVYRCEREGTEGFKGNVKLPFEAVRPEWNCHFVPTGP